MEGSRCAVQKYWWAASELVVQCKGAGRSGHSGSTGAMSPEHTDNSVSLGVPRRENSSYRNDDRRKGRQLKVMPKIGTINGPAI